MNASEKILQFLENPDYLRLALAVEDRMPEVRRRLLKKLWTHIFDDLRKRLDDLPADVGSAVWEVPEPKDWNQSEQNDFCIVIAPTEASLSPKQWYVEFTLQRESDQLWIGVGPNRWKVEKFTGNMKPVSKALANLKRRLIESGLTPRTDWFIAWRCVHAPPLTETTDSLCRIAKDDAFAREMAGELWTLFLEHRDLAQQTNQRLRSI